MPWGFNVEMLLCWSFIRPFLMTGLAQQSIFVFFALDNDGNYEKGGKDVECSRIFRYMSATVIVTWNKINCPIFNIRKKLCPICFFPFNNKDDKLPKPNYQHDKRQRELEKKKKKEEKKHRKQTTEDVKPEEDPGPLPETDQQSWMPESRDDFFHGRLWSERKRSSQTRLTSPHIASAERCSSMDRSKRTEALGANSSSPFHSRKSKGTFGNGRSL